jgi:site-specific DNA recombinase
MWMGGVPPLGYRVEDRKLIIVDSEAEMVRAVFRRYAELSSVRILKEEVEARGIKSKSWTSASGRPIGGKPFSRGALYLILQNPIYRARSFTRQSHPGARPPIVDQPLWEVVQAQLAGNPPSATRASYSSKRSSTRTLRSYPRAHSSSLALAKLDQ